jgi:ADP-ribosyl-[dinitrogen reductase] hydrolase
MMSDDGEHACMVAQCLCEWAGDVNNFQRKLARRLRWWLLGIPAGIGGATLRSILKLWIGIPPTHSGVFSAGNGPAMRSVVLGAAIEDLMTLREMAAASTRITHTDPKAFYGAMAVALAARVSAGGGGGRELVALMHSEFERDGARELVELIESAVRSAAAGEATTEFAEHVGCERGVSGYIYKTVPVAIHAWLRNPTCYASAVRDAIACGGDTDTVAAIAGGVVGARVGAQGIPLEWRERLLEWPRTLTWIEALASGVERATSTKQSVRAPRVGVSVLPRNLLFILVIAGHLVRRAMPPY